MNEHAEIIQAPWYRDRWPWMILSIPAASALLGIVMLVLAMNTNDGLVAEDYYKQGLGINQVLDKEARARRLHIRAEMTVSGGAVRVALSGEQGNAGALLLRMTHPTRAGEDRVLRLRMSAPDIYEGEWRGLGEGRWHAVLEDEAGTWRLKGLWQNGRAGLNFRAEIAQ